MPSLPQHRRPVVVRPGARGRTVVSRRRPARNGGGLVVPFVLLTGAFGILLAALVSNNNESNAEAASRKPAAAESSAGYDHMLAEIVSRIKTSQSVDVLLANRATFHQEINDSTTLTDSQKESLRWEVIREVDARQNAMTKASFQR